MPGTCRAPAAASGHYRDRDEEHAVLLKPVPDVRRTDRFSSASAKRFSTSISTASSCSQSGHVSPTAPASCWTGSLPPGTRCVRVPGVPGDPASILPARLPVPAPGVYAGPVIWPPGRTRYRTTVKAGRRPVTESTHLTGASVSALSALPADYLRVCALGHMCGVERRSASSGRPQRRRAVGCLREVEPGHGRYQPMPLLPRSDHSVRFPGGR